MATSSVGEMSPSKPPNNLDVKGKRMQDNNTTIKTKGGQTFILEILNTQNNTWQGTVLWTKTQQKIPFRSALELIHLLDSAVGTDEIPDAVFKK